MSQQPPGNQGRPPQGNPPQGNPPQGNPPQGRPPQGRPQQGQPQQGQPGQPGQPGAAQPGAAEIEQPALAYGQHLVDHGPGLTGKEKAMKKVKVPAQISIVFSMIYATLLTLAVIGTVKSFMDTSAFLEMNRTAGPSGGSGKARGAKAKRDAAKRKREQEAKEQAYQTARRILFASFGFGLAVYLTAITGQWSGVVAGYRLANLKSYRWALWGNIFAAIPFLSIFYLSLFLAVSELDNVGGQLIVVIFMIGYGSLDFIRFCISVLCLITLFTAAPRRFFEIK